MTPITTAIEYFSESELACKGSGIIILDPRFAEEIVELRREWGRPINPNSVCRTPEHNKKVGGHPRSLHLTENPKWETYGSMAMDVRWGAWTHETQLDFAQLALDLGWRVGLNDAFCHIDRGLDVGITRAIFTYGSYSGSLHWELEE